MTTINKQTHNKELQISYLTLRKAIGWIAILLPFALLIGNYVVNQLDIFNNPWLMKISCHYHYTANSSYKNSVSHYYYTSVGELFTGAIGSVALFLFCYKGHPKRRGETWFSDNFMAKLAGAFAMGLVIFPVSSEECIRDNMRTFLSSQNTSYIHFTSAALFFICLALMSIINFRRTSTIADFGKGANAKIYLWCGIIILACLVIIFVYDTFLYGMFPMIDRIRPVFILESITLMAFGFSWLMKGKIKFNYIPRKLKSKIRKPRTRKIK